MGFGGDYSNIMVPVRRLQLPVTDGTVTGAAKCGTRILLIVVTRPKGESCLFSLQLLMHIQW